MVLANRNLCGLRFPALPDAAVVDELKTTTPSRIVTAEHAFYRGKETSQEVLAAMLHHNMGVVRGEVVPTFERIRRRLNDKVGGSEDQIQLRLDAHTEESPVDKILHELGVTAHKLLGSPRFVRPDTVPRHLGVRFEELDFESSVACALSGPAAFGPIMSCLVHVKISVSALGASFSMSGTDWTRKIMDTYANVFRGHGLTQIP